MHFLIASFAVASTGCAVKINRLDQEPASSPLPVSSESPTLSTARVLLASDFANSMLRSYLIDDATGVLSPVSTYSTATKPHYITGFKAANVYYAYANDMSGPTSSVYGVSINPSTGAMTPLATVGIIMSAGGNAEDILHVKQGESHFLYVNDVQNSELHGFVINATTGGLTPLPGSPYNIAYGGACSWGRMAANSAGTRLYISCEYDNPNDRILGLSIGVTGAISGQLPSSPYAMPAGSAPYDLAFSADGTTLYVSFSEASAIGVYSVVPGDGSLASALPGSPFMSIVTGNPLGNLWVDPTLNHLYLSVFGANANSLQLFQIAGDKTLSAAQSLASAAGGGSDVAGTSDGKMVIFSSIGGGLASYARNPTTGALSQNGAVISGAFDGILVLE